MTNIEKARQLGSKEVITLIRKIETIEAKKYIDWEKWLTSNLDKEFWDNNKYSFPVKAKKKVKFVMYGNSEEKAIGYMIKKTVMLGRPYAVIVTEDYKVVKVPEDRVEVM